MMNKFKIKHGKNLYRSGFTTKSKAEFKKVMHKGDKLVEWDELDENL
jgi:hypothetical protein